MSGHLEYGHNTVSRASTPHHQSSSSCLFPHLVFTQRYCNRQAALAVMSPALQYPLLGFHPLLLHLHTPLALPQPVHILLILQQLGLQLLSLAAQTLSLQEAPLLSLLQQALMLALETGETITAFKKQYMSSVRDGSIMKSFYSSAKEGNVRRVRSWLCCLPAVFLWPHTLCPSAAALVSA